MQNGLKLGIKSATEVDLNLWSNVVGDFKSETNIPQVLLSTNTQVSKFCKTFGNNLLVNIKLLKTQLP